ncbi:MAG: redoxin family protein [Cytophagales bacterium]|nr:redoxin family protein [Cytophagales bacterium]
MNLSLRNCLVLCIIIVGSCDFKSPQKTVHIRVSGVKEHSVAKVVSHKDLYETILATAQPDSLGVYDLQFSLTQVTFAYIHVNNSITEVYLKPGYNIHVNFNEDGSSITCAEDGGLNNHLLQMTKQLEAIKLNGKRFVPEKYIASLELQAFNKRFDSLKNALDELNNQYINQNNLSKEIIELLTTVKEINLKNVLMEYFLLYQNNEGIRKYEDRLKGLNTVLEIPKDISEMGENVPYDTVLLELGYAGYYSLLHMLFTTSIFDANLAIEDWELHKRSYPIVINSDLNKSTYPARIKEHLIVLNFINWSFDGHTPALDSILVDFKNKHANSGYLPALQKMYNESFALAPGNAAPSFKGTTLEGETIALSEFKGKLVYIDIWATWCGPCIEEIPHAKKLYEKFSGTGQIEFLNVSVDENRNAWKKMLEAGKGASGTHINLQGDDYLSFFDSYKIRGFPTYMLIDREGKIINLKASRPSSAKIYDDLNSLLENE